MEPLWDPVTSWFILVFQRTRITLDVPIGIVLMVERD